ncbi:Rab-GAP TBC domain-containing protein [Balamuthia mandrillaris]
MVHPVIDSPSGTTATMPSTADAMVQRKRPRSRTNPKSMKKASVATDSTANNPKNNSFNNKLKKPSSPRGHTSKTRAIPTPSLPSPLPSPNPLPKPQQQPQEKRWAGGSWQMSPPPSALPMPRLLLHPSSPPASPYRSPTYAACCNDLMQTEKAVAGRHPPSPPLCRRPLFVELR